ncbi:peptidase M23 [Methylophaga sp. 42_25_T18]|nr:peptidase M23 [Methylophaga sp. 42_25_T18]OUR86503.1 peptidase M23 [Methylophaga sp. 42_8_T64]
MLTRLFLIGSLLCCFSSSWAEADSAQRLENVQSEIQTLDKNLAKSKASKQELYQQLKQQSRSISKLNRQLVTLEKELKQKAKELILLGQKQSSQQQSHTQQIDALFNQIRTAYIQSQPSYIKILLSQNNPATLARSTTYYRYFHQARQQQLAELEQSLSNLTEQQKQLFSTQKVQQQLHKQQQQQQLALQQQTQQRQSTLALLETKISSQDAQLVSLREEEQSLHNLLQSLNAAPKSKVIEQKAATKQKSFSKRRGALTWPVKGKLLARYGSSRNLGKLTWKGIMIAAPTGKDIVASAPGKVVFADWLRGFGLLMIIDHGDQYMTLYGNNETLLRQAGDNVSAGELIAQSGVQSMHKHAGLYFEIRHKGSPTNPLRWLSKKS